MNKSPQSNTEQPINTPNMLSQVYPDAPARILAIDDEASIRFLLKEILKLEGYDVITLASAEEALTYIEEQGLPHLAIVDINMPGMGGLAFCERVLQFVDLPIIILTVVDDEDTIVQSIEQFAEDYVVKPFRSREFIARVQRVLRRIGHFAYPLGPLTVVDDKLSVDFAHQEVILNGEKVSLTKTENKLLYILMRNAGNVVTSEFLLSRVWPHEEVYEDTLRVHVHRLRHKIETNPSKPKYIVTKRGLGYAFGS